MKPRVFRSTPSFVLGWVWMAFAAAFLVDTAVRGRDVASAIAAGSLLLGAGVAYVIGLRPRVVADEEGVRLHNPLRDVWLSWSEVDKIETTDVIEIYSGDRKFRAYALQTSPRARVRADIKSRRAGKDSRVPEHVAEYIKGKLPIDFAADQLNELATQSRRQASSQVAGNGTDHASGQTTEQTAAASPSVAPSWFAVGALVVPVIFLAAAILIAILY
jgi:hypothetical protein